MEREADPESGQFQSGNFRLFGVGGIGPGVALTDQFGGRHPLPCRVGTRAVRPFRAVLDSPFFYQASGGRIETNQCSNLAQRPAAGAFLFVEIGVAHHENGLFLITEFIVQIGSHSNSQLLICQSMQPIRRGPD